MCFTQNTPPGNILSKNCPVQSDERKPRMLLILLSRLDDDDDEGERNDDDDGAERNGDDDDSLKESLRESLWPCWSLVVHLQQR